MPSRGSKRRARRGRKDELQQSTPKDDSLPSNGNLYGLEPQSRTTIGSLGAWGKGPPQTGSNFEEYTGGSSGSVCSSCPKGEWVKGSPVKGKTEFTNPLTDSEKSSDDDGFFPWVKEFLETESNPEPTMSDFLTSNNLRFYRQNLTTQQLDVFDTELAKTGNIPHAIMTVRDDCKLGEGPGNLGRGEGPKYTTLSNGFANPNSSEMILLFGRPD